MKGLIGIALIMFVVGAVGTYIFISGFKSGMQESKTSSEGYVEPKPRDDSAYQVQSISQEQTQAQRLTQELNANVETMNHDRGTSDQIVVQWNNQAKGINNMILVANNYVTFLNYAQPHLYQFSVFLERNRYTFENGGLSLYSYEKGIIDTKALYANNINTMKTAIENERQRLEYQQQLTQQENEQTMAILNAFVQIAPLLAG